jgi:hypothetical protein
MLNTAGGTVISAPDPRCGPQRNQRRVLLVGGDDLRLRAQFSAGAHINLPTRLQLAAYRLYYRLIKA